MARFALVRWLGMLKSRRRLRLGKSPILHDCAAGIADVQVRNQGTIGGLSFAEADP